MGQEEVTKELSDRKSPQVSIPDVYVNNVRFLITVYDIQMNFGVLPGPDEEPEDVAIIRMSPQLALAMSKLLEKNLQAYEERVGKINLPQELLENLGLEENG